MMKQVDDFLTKASTKGFRTLLMAMRVLTKEELDQFLERCVQAEKDLQNREKALEKVYSEIE